MGGVGRWGAVRVCAGGGCDADDSKGSDGDRRQASAGVHWYVLSFEKIVLSKLSKGPALRNCVLGREVQ